MNRNICKACLVFLSVWSIGVAALHADEDNLLSVHSASGAQNIGASLFTGQVSYTIPVYKLNDPDFPLEIAFRYQTDGFKPFQPSGCYGQGWSLIAGGYVARSMQQFPDEHKTEYEVQQPNQSRSLIGMRESIAEYCLPDKDSVFTMASSVYDDDCGVACPFGADASCVWEVDYMPDIFSFDFMGHSGRFMIDNQGEAVILSGDFVDVDMSQFKEIYYRTSYAYTWENDLHDTITSRITISTTDGYKYVFGGNAESMEFSSLANIDNFYNHQRVPAVNKWYLTSVIAPNSRQMVFKYKRNGNLRFFITDYDWTEESMLDDSTHLMCNLQKVCLLDSITTSDSIPFVVKFFSSEETHPMYDNPLYVWSQPVLQLDSIAISCNSRVLQSARLLYNYRKYNLTYGVTTNYYWRYLSSVKLSGVGTYSLTYNDIDPYPATMPAIFHLFTYPKIEVKSDSAYKAMVDRFGFWQTTSLQGLLANISLPTGGRIRFTYGAHQYGLERRFRAVDSQNVELYTQSASNETIGGARIEKIETFSDANTLVETKQYTYTQIGSANSSGIFYNIYELFMPPHEPKAIANPYNYSMIDSHVGYAYVTQITTTGNVSYKTTYTFDTGHAFYTSYNSPFINRNNDVRNYSDTAELCSGSLTYKPDIIQTGKLLAVEQYIGNTLQKATHFRYNGITNTATILLPYQGTSLGCTDTIVCLSTYSAHVARKIFIYPNILEQVVTYEYDSTAANAVFTSSLSYTYDSKLRIKEMITTDSRGRKSFMRYTYPDEIPGANYIGGFPSALFLMTHSNRIGRPVETLSGYVENNTEFITSGALDIYTTHTFPANGVLNLKPYKYQSLSLSLSQPLNSRCYQPLNMNNGQLIYDPHYKLDCQYNYDIMERLISSKPLGRIATTYTWEGINPVTKTTGNQTWTYTYIPYVGIRTVTNPRGITTYYSYDAAGRLIEEYRIINGQKQVVNVYYYHIKTE